MGANIKFNKITMAASYEKQKVILQEFRYQRSN